MAVIALKPYTPGRRGMVVRDYSEYSKEKPKKSLLVKQSNKSGRSSSSGRITVRHKGGRSKRHYRLVDFKRRMDNVPAKVIRFEYDPNRNASLALILYANGKYDYIIATKKMAINDEIISGLEAPIKEGNALPLANIPVGTMLCCIEMKPGKGAQLARAAGGYVQLMGKESGFALLSLRSGERRRVSLECRATIGVVGNDDHNLLKIGTAGRKRRMGIRPTVRGVAMNPVDHPHGGGEGRTSGGRPSCSPWAKPECRTRDKKKASNKYIVRSRHRANKRKK